MCSVSKEPLGPDPPPQAKVEKSVKLRYTSSPIKLRIVRVESSLTLFSVAFNPPGASASCPPWRIVVSVNLWMDCCARVRVCLFDEQEIELTAVPSPTTIQSLGENAPGRNLYVVNGFFKGLSSLSGKVLIITSDTVKMKGIW